MLVAAKNAYWRLFGARFEAIGNRQSDDLAVLRGDLKSIEASITGISTDKLMFSRGRPVDYLIEHDEWARGVIDGVRQAPRGIIGSSWEPGTPHYAIASNGLMQAEFEYARGLLRQLSADGVPGAVVEFGVFEGMWLGILLDHLEEANLHRAVYGLDSFEGLPSTGADDLDCWAEGQFRADYEAVAKKLRLEDRPLLHLLKGWFSDTLPTADMQDLKQVAFARIDCDLYAPTVEALEYLAPRLVDGSVLVFDDWTWNIHKGETKAFREWARLVPFKFDFLSYNFMGHLYLRVLRS